MEAQLTSEVNPTNFAKWIGDCVEVKFHTNPEFVMALIQVVFKHIGKKIKPTLIAILLHFNT